MKLLKKLTENFNKLETIEEKSFWVIAPTITFLGLSGLLTAGLYTSATPTLISAFLCLVIPILLMVFVYYKKNYHYAYPLLCIFIGGISIPITFVFSGGFLSGMPLFCTICTGITALCYSDKLRKFALLGCLFGNSIAFVYVYFVGTPYPLIDNYTIYDDIIYSYFFSAIGLYFTLGLIIKELRKLKFSQDTLNKYFDKGIRDEILSNALNDNLLSVHKNQKVVILFADISNFTSITEKMPSNLVTDFLNTFFTISEKHIHLNNGFIDKYIGDCVMAYWINQDDHNSVYEAIKTVFDIRKELLENAENIYERFGTELYFSSGISYGDVIFSEIGSESIRDYTVIGDAVNVASRIQEYSVAGELLISNNAASEVNDLVELELVKTDLYFKGKNESVNLYRVLDLQKKINSNIKVDTENINGYSLYVLGCRGSFPVSGIRFSEYGGETSCYLIKKDDYALIIDCGTGLKNADVLLKDVKKIDILLTHVHYDHILGLLVSKLPSSADITLYCHFAKWNANSQILNNFMHHPYWPIGIDNMNKIDVEIGDEIILSKNIKAYFYKSDHPDEACVITLDCNGKKICFFADCENPYKLDPNSYINADLLFYDGMYDENDYINHIGWGHGSWQQGIKFAKNENIKKLMITHHNPELGDHTLNRNEAIARKLSSNVSFAKAGDKIVI